MKIHFAALALALIPLAALADVAATVDDEFGILNPQDTGREMLTRKIQMGSSTQSPARWGST